MTTTPDLGIPELAQSQANPDVTHNEALVLVQSLLNGVVDRGINTPAVGPTEGDAYIVGSAPTGAWTGRANVVAIYWGASWRFVPGNDDSGTPITMGARQEGLRVFVRDEDAFYTWDGSSWVNGIGGVSDGDKGDITVSGGGTVWNIDAGAVGDTELRDSAALSVIGRAANSIGDPGDIVASANDRLLARVSDALAFQQLTNGMVPTNTIGLDKLANASAQYNLIGRTSSSGGAWEQKATSADVFTMLGSANNAAIRSNIGADSTYVDVAGDTMTGALTVGPLLTSVAVTAIRNDNANNNFESRTSHGSNTGGTYRGTKTRGSSGSETACNNADQLAALIGRGHDGTSFTGNVAAFNFTAAEAFATGAHGTRFGVELTPTGATVRAEYFGILPATGILWQSNAVIDQNRHHRLRSYTVATLPSASPAGQLIYVSDETGGAVPCFSDNTNWRRVTDRAIAA